MHRFAFAILVSLCVVALLAACGDDDGGGNGEASRTPFIAPPTLSPEDAIVELDAIIEQVNNPDQEIVDESGVGEFELMTRATEVTEGTAQVPGLNEVRSLLEEPDLILAREFLHNNVVEIMAVPFADADTATISADAMQTVDPQEAFAPRGEDFEVSAIFRDAVLRSIELWYLI